MIIDDEHERRLATLAAQRAVGADVMAGEMLTEVLDGFELDGARVTEILDATPGAWERAQEAMEQVKRGEGIPLSDLL